MIKKYLPFLPPKNPIYGTDQDDNLLSTQVSDIIFGGDGSDRIWAGAGADDLYGGKGDDHYYITNANDFAYENVGEGTDTVYSSVSYTLGANIEWLYLQGNQSINGTGNDLDNIICGTDGNNILKGFGGWDYFWGGQGADTMYGGVGDDQFDVDNVGDVVVELAGEGYDEVFSSINFSLVGTDVEQLFLKTGAGAINGTGNDLDNTISGNESNNILKGGDGRDFIDGRGGNDTMYGGTDGDYFVVDSAGDVVIEYAGEGDDDMIYTTVSYGMTDNVEKMYMAGDNAVDGWGNGQDNTIQGSSANNYIFGLGGKDTIYGDIGNDTINGGWGDDRLHGGKDTNTLTGGKDNDTFLFKQNGGHDTVTDFKANGDLDVIETGLFGSFASIQAAMQQVGSDTVITFDADHSMTLQNVNMASLQASDFHII